MVADPGSRAWKYERSLSTHEQGIFMHEEIKGEKRPM
jgi:hypothetical protein